MSDGQPFRPLHDTPCIIHGGTCDHDEVWLHHFQAVHDHGIPADLNTSDWSLWTSLLIATIDHDPWRLQAPFEFKAWMRSHYQDQAKNRRTLLASLLRLRDAKIITLDFDPLTQTIGHIGWNTAYDEWQKIPKDAYWPPTAAMLRAVKSASEGGDS